MELPLVGGFDLRTYSSWAPICLMLVVSVDRSLCMELWELEASIGRVTHLLRRQEYIHWLKLYDWKCYITKRENFPFKLFRSKDGGFIWWLPGVMGQVSMWKSLNLRDDVQPWTSLMHLFVFVSASVFSSDGLVALEVTDLCLFSDSLSSYQLKDLR